MNQLCQRTPLLKKGLVKPPNTGSSPESPNFHGHEKKDAEDWLDKKLERQPHNVNIDARYKWYNNHLNKILEISKHGFFSSKIALANNDSKATWKVIDEALYKRKMDSNVTAIIDGNDIMVNNTAISNVFIDDFASAGTISNAISCNNTCSLPGRKNVKYIFFYLATNNEIRKINIALKTPRQ